MQHLPIEKKAAHHWEVYLDFNVCYLLREGRLVEAFKIGKVSGILPADKENKNSAPEDVSFYIRYAQLYDISISRGEDDKTLEAPEARGVQRHLSFMKKIIEGRGVTFHHAINFDVLAQKVEEVHGVAYRHELTLDEAQKLKLMLTKFSGVIDPFVAPYNPEADGRKPDSEILRVAFCLEGIVI